MSRVFEYPVLRVRVIDGDSQDIDCDMGFKTWHQCTTRLVNLDTPERFSEAGRLVTQVVEAWVAEVNSDRYRLIWQSCRLDKYGRSLGDFIDSQHPDRSLVQHLLINGLARKYLGGKRVTWSPEELDAVAASATRLLGH